MGKFILSMSRKVCYFIFISCTSDVAVMLPQICSIADFSYLEFKEYLCAIFDRSVHTIYKVFGKDSWSAYCLH